jgi:uncharacterized protein (TIGR03437 family)
MWASRWCFGSVLSLAIVVPAVRADPPGATVRTKLLVPGALRVAPFDSDRYATVPPGFEMSLWARLPGARFIAVAANGDVFVSQPSAGRVMIFRPDPGGGVPASFVYASGLRNPHGLTFDQQNGSTWLCVAESNQVDRYLYVAGDTSAPRAQVIVSNLPDNSTQGYAHPLKSLAVGPDHSLYVGIGSSCNACAEDIAATPERASIWRYKGDGAGGQLFAAGLRNPEGLAFVPGTNSLWAAVNNRDELPYPFHDATGLYGKLVRTYVDDHPPEPFTAVRAGGNYGWPFCNSNPDTPSGINNMPLDADQDNNSDNHVNCSAMDRASKGIQAHSAPLGLTFLQGSTFAAPWREGAVIAYHGSWDRSTPTGYKVVWFPWDPLKQAPGAESDLVTGFEGWGRPVASAVLADGSLLITDDSAGAIYHLRWAPSAVSATNGYPVVAPGSYSAIYGSGLTDRTATAGLPYPATLAGVSLTVTDSAGHAMPASLVYVSPAQINFVLPDGLAEGSAHVVLQSGTGARDLGFAELRSVAPGLFSLNGSGSGAGAVVALDADGHQVGFPVDVSQGPVYISLYGTGIRGAALSDVQVSIGDNSVPVMYAGAQGTFPGLDQVNVRLPVSLAGAGEVSVRLQVGGVSSNSVTIRVH